MTFALETRGLTIRFGGHVAVNAVSCGFAPGTLTAIVGPNGAGKTTYFNLISGQLKSSAGRVLLHGEDLSACSAPQRSRRGIGRALMLNLIDTAAAAGLETMVGDILSTNAPMLHFMRSLGFAVESSPDGPEIRRVTIRLAPGAAADKK